MSKSIKRLVEAVQEAFRNGDKIWIRTTAEVADYFLNVLPPIYGPGSFACSEPYTDNAEGHPVYLAFRNVSYLKNTAEAQYLTLKEIKEP